MSRKVIVGLLTKLGVKDAGTLNAERALKKLSRRIADQGIPADATPEELEVLKINKITAGDTAADPGEKLAKEKAEPETKAAKAVKGEKPVKEKAPKPEKAPGTTKGPGRERDGNSGLSIMREALVSGKNMPYADLKKLITDAGVSERTFGHYISRTSREVKLLGFLTEREVLKDEDGKVVGKLVRREGGEEVKPAKKAKTVKA